MDAITQERINKLVDHLGRVPSAGGNEGTNLYVEWGEIMASQPKWNRLGKIVAGVVFAGVFLLFDAHDFAASQYLGLILGLVVGFLASMLTLVAVLFLGNSAAERRMIDWAARVEHVLGLERGEKPS